MVVFHILAMVMLPTGITSVNRIPGPLPSAKREAIFRHFDAALFDGRSARWLWPKQQAKSGVYCGWVNAKNRIGAYTGWKPYWVTFDEAGKVHDGNIVAEDDSRILLEAFCQGYEIKSAPTG